MKVKTLKFGLLFLLLFIQIFGVSNNIIIKMDLDNISSNNEDENNPILNFVNSIKKENKYNNPSIQQFLETGKFPDIVFDNRIIILSNEKLPYLQPTIPPFNFGSNYLYFTNILSRADMRRLLIDPSVTTIIPDYKINLTSIEPIDNENVSPSSFSIKDILRTEQVWNQYNITGKGVTIGVVDTGVDFGVSDLSSSAKLLSSGITASLDTTGAGIAFSNLTIPAENRSGGTYLPLSNFNLTIWQGELLSFQNSANLGLRLSDIEITGIERPSLTNEYKVGMIYQPRLAQSLPDQFYIFVLSDATTPGIYDTIYIDFSTSIGITLSRNGIILESGETYLRLVDWSLTDETPFGANNPILARDLDNDGINDVSVGALATTLDLYGVITGGNPGVNPMLKGIDPGGRGFSLLYDPIGHGTLVASAAAARGKTPIYLFDDASTREVENNTAYYLPGSAPSAKIVAVKGLTIQDYMIGWLWVAGLELKTDLFGNIGWESDSSTIEHRVEISSNSWGNGLIADEGTIKGQDFTSLFLDLVAMPDSLYTNYPGMIFVVANGNAGPGYGTIATPATASMALSIGASSTYLFKENNGKNDLAWFSSRGPTPLGIIKPDVVTPGNTGYVHYRLISGNGNGTLAAGTFGGTSEATPRASGVIALMIEAMRKQGIDPNFGNIRVILKSTARDIGFPSVAQGTGLVDAYSAVSSIMGSDTLIIRNKNPAILFGNRLQEAFGTYFQDTNNQPLTHPLLLYQYDDAVVSTNLTMLKTGIDIEVTFGNGTKVPENYFNMNIKRLEQTLSSKFTIDTNGAPTALINLETVWTLPKKWKNADLLQISLSLIEESWEDLQQIGLSTPDLILSDTTSKKIIYDLISQITWQQQLYSGNPKNDFAGDPLLEIPDPWFENELDNSPGLKYLGFAQVYDYLNWSKFDVISNLGSVSITSTQLPQEMQYGILEFTIAGKNNSQNIPFSIAVEEDVGFGDNATIVGDDLSISVPYDLDQFYGSLDWGYRPESGDFRSYRLSVPDEATFLAIQGVWNDEGFLPDMYLFDNTGVLVDQTDVTYIGGGFYQSTSSEPFAQNLLVPVTTRTYTLLVHVVRMPFDPEPVQFNLLTRYLTLPKIPAPIPTYSPDLSNNIQGNLSINTASYTVEQFPELKISQVNTQVYQGNNGSFSGSLDKNILVENPAENLGMIEAIKLIQFSKGEKVRLKMNWTGMVDLDLYVFPLGEPFDLSKDLLKGQGTTPNNFTEIANFAAPHDGQYIILIDYVSGQVDTSIPYDLIWESRRGPTIRADSNILSFDTSIFPNGKYGLASEFETNFGISFSQFESVTFENHKNFTASIIQPSEGKVSDDVTISWESSKSVFASIILEIDLTEIILGKDIISTSFTFDSTLYPNGPAKIIVILTDRIYSHEYKVNIEIDNTVFSTLPPQKTTEEKSLPTLSAYFTLSIFALMSSIIKKRRKSI